MALARLLWRSHRARRLARRSPAALEAWQAVRLRALVAWAAARSVAWRERLHGVDPARARLEDLPVLTKDELMARFDDLVTDPRVRAADLAAWVQDPRTIDRRYLGRYVVFNTSGTSSRQALVVYDAHALDTILATAAVRHPPPSYWRAASAPGGRARRRLPLRSAVLLVTGGAYPASVALRHGPRLPRWLARAEVLSLLQPLEDLKARLEALAPDHLVTYASLLGLLARERLAGRLALDLDPRRATVHTVSEMLTEPTRDLVRRAWGLEVADTYGAGECLVIARTCCAHGGLHLMGDLCLLEAVDERHRPLPPGETGHHVLVTNLVNRVLPIVRYVLDDRTGLDAAACPCGSPFPRLLPVAGRSFDVYWFDGPAGRPVPVHSSALTSGVVALGGVLEYQLVQERRDALVFRYVPAPGKADPAHRYPAVFAADLARIGLAGLVAIRFERVDALPRDPRTGKLRKCLPLPPPPPPAQERAGAS